MQEELMADGVQLAPRDMMIAATARSTETELVVTDSDFVVEPLRKYMDIRKLRSG
ncbi:MAG: twitching motility protein PilT [Halorhabdus sp.]